MDNKQSSSESDRVEARTPSNHQFAPTAFSIATPAVTTILPMTENMSDTSFMLPASSYQQDAMVEKAPQENPIEGRKVVIKDEPETVNKQTNLQSEDRREVAITTPQETLGLRTTIDTPQPASSGQQSTVHQEDVTKSGKKRSKTNKKSTKLDAKSKLEKSRQSARECRARKKLRYQYLEDLVCNREKAVIKLREELSMFCELSKHIDKGTVSEMDRRLLVDQTKEFKEQLS